MLCDIHALDSSISIRSTTCILCIAFVQRRFRFSDQTTVFKFNGFVLSAPIRVIDCTLVFMHALVYWTIP